MLSPEDTGLAKAAAAGSLQPGASVSSWRKQKRVELLQARNALSPEVHRRQSERVLENLSAIGRDFTGSLVGFYWPLPGEISVLPFIERVFAEGGSAALPVVIGKDKALEFRTWRPEDRMEAGVFGTVHPLYGAAVEPDVLILPLVGFDDGCYRLGYGGGYYDRTLRATLRKPLTIGVGFDIGRLNTIYPQPYDVALDIILTESATYGSLDR